MRDIFIDSFDAWSFTAGSRRRNCSSAENRSPLCHLGRPGSSGRLSSARLRNWVPSADSRFSDQRCSALHHRQTQVVPGKAFRRLRGCGNSRWNCPAEQLRRSPQRERHRFSCCSLSHCSSLQPLPCSPVGSDPLVQHRTGPLEPGECSSDPSLDRQCSGCRAWCPLVGTAQTDR